MLVCPSASVALKGRVGTQDYTELAFPGGHIGIYVSGAAQKTVPPAIGDWINKRTGWIRAAAPDDVPISRARHPRRVGA